MSRELVIGLEIHLKLNSPNKLFCLCVNSQDFDDIEPNTNICPVCSGQPGALPVLNKEPLEKAVQLGLALGCTINHVSTFDRKSYFYPDLPMGYQITQQHTPTNVDGEVSFFVDKEFSITKQVTIRDAHIETDTGKTTQEGGKAHLDYNRAATPLVEIVTQPDFRSADEVIGFLQELQRIARYNNLSDAEMEKGQMRCDVNISLREVGETEYRTRVELKNMSSFSAVRRAIDHEMHRQTQVYADGNQVAQETRGWDDATTESYVMRSKEDAMDYRYIPEPDLPPVVLDAEWMETQRNLVVESPYARIQRYKQTFGFNKEYINGLINTLAMNTYFESCVTDGYDPKLVATWLVGPVARWLGEQEQEKEAIEALDNVLAFSYEQFTNFLQLQLNDKLENQQAKIVMKEMLRSGKDPEDIIEEKGLHPVGAEQVHAWVQEIFNERPDILDELKAGNMKLMGFVTGQVMKKSGGAANPTSIQEQVQTFL